MTEILMCEGAVNKGILESFAWESPIKLATVGKNLMINSNVLSFWIK